MKNVSLIPQQATTDHDIAQCFLVLSELRPHLANLPSEDFVSMVRDMEQQGYCMVFIRENGSVVAVAGFRINTNLFMGKHLYVDDLVTAAAHRSKGYGERMMSWLRQHAIAHHCRYLHLDSGTHRGQAHKFYFAQGMTIASYHFSEKLIDDAL